MAHLVDTEEKRSFILKSTNELVFTYKYNPSFEMRTAPQTNSDYFSLNTAIIPILKTLLQRLFL